MAHTLAAEPHRLGAVAINRSGGCRTARAAWPTTSARARPRARRPRARAARPRASLAGRPDQPCRPRLDPGQRAARRRRARRGAPAGPRGTRRRRRRRARHRRSSLAAPRRRRVRSSSDRTSRTTCGPGPCCGAARTASHVVRTVPEVLGPSVAGLGAPLPRAAPRPRLQRADRERDPGDDRAGARRRPRDPRPDDLGPAVGVMPHGPRRRARQSAGSSSTTCCVPLGSDRVALPREVGARAARRPAAPHLPSSSPRICRLATSRRRVVDAVAGGAASDLLTRIDELAASVGRGAAARAARGRPLRARPQGHPAGARRRRPSGRPSSSRCRMPLGSSPTTARSCPSGPPPPSSTSGRPPRPATVGRRRPRLAGLDASAAPRRAASRRHSARPMPSVPTSSGRRSAAVRREVLR